MRGQVLSLLLTLALLSLSTPAGATVIYVSGDQTGTWAADTVIVTGEVRVPPNEALTVEPGTQVLFQDLYKFIVDQNATLTAVGTSTDSIRFDRLYLWVHWHGIHFQSASPNSQLEYCQILHGQTTAFPDWSGGGIFCSQSSPTIRHCLIAECSAEGDGGGIYLAFSNPLITDNSFVANEAVYDGGGVYCGGSSSPIISGNLFIGNNVMWYYGGGLCVWGTGSPQVHDNTFTSNTAIATGGGGSGGGLALLDVAITVHDNVFTNNSAFWLGGGIFCQSANPLITDNILTGNSAGTGGGIACDELVGLTISHNLIAQNSADYGGAIGSPDGHRVDVNYNTIVGNSASQNGGGFYGDDDNSLTGDILWGNTPNQLYTFQTQNIPVSYCDIQFGYAGTGNINAYPAFVDTAQGDYRLQWGSPCIDTGDPNPIYNDPDGTRADMGAWYYDQTMPVRILLTPYNAPIQIPAGGGSFQYAIQATNIESATLSALVWCDVTLPSGGNYGPVLGPVTISLTFGQTLSRVRTQTVPAGAPAGLYHYNAFAVAVGDTSEDSFTFTKLGYAGWDLGPGGWTNVGDDFTSNVGASAAVDAAPMPKPVD